MFFIGHSTIDSRNYKANCIKVPSSNPVDYAYKLLEDSGRYPDATWNV